MRVTIRDDKPVVVEVSLPIDPVQRITYNFAGQPMAFGLLLDGKRLNYQTAGGIQTTFKIDERIIQPGVAPGRMEVNRGPLPPHLGRKRLGEQAVYVFENLRFTQTVEVVPGKPSARYEPGQKRHMDSVLVQHYFLDFHMIGGRTIALRVFMDVLLIDNDGALFAAPNFPNKILDGVVLKDQQVPDYLQVLQRPDLKNPGFVAHYTYALGRDRERPSRVVLTGLRAFNQWEMQALQAGGDSAMAMFWDAKTLQPGGKRELAHFFWAGTLASNPENEGRKNCPGAAPSSRASCSAWPPTSRIRNRARPWPWSCRQAWSASKARNGSLCPRRQPAATASSCGRRAFAIRGSSPYASAPARA